MLNTKVIVETNKGKRYYGILTEIKDETVTLFNYVNMEKLKLGNFARQANMQAIILGVCEISKCTDKEIDLIESGIIESEIIENEE